jgi:hypothetical protein
MIGRWRIDDDGRAIPPAPSVIPTVDKVLVEYDGPQWLIVSYGSQKYAAYAADEIDDRSVVRWVESPVSGVEVRALMGGRMPLRDAILKPECRVVDYAYGRERPLRAWGLSSSDIPDVCLPDDDAFLPTFSREPIAVPERASVEFECDGPSIRDNTITFSALGDFISHLQRVWTSIGDTVKNSTRSSDEWGFSTLAFAGSRPGSFAIDAASGESAIEIATKYRDIVRASYGPAAKLETAMSIGGPNLQAAFRDYMAVLTARKMDVLVNWRQDGAFVGHDCAARAKDTIGAFGGSAAVRDGDIVVRGHLSGWMTDRKSFEFHDLSSGAYIGKVHQKVSEMWRTRPPTLGNTETIYRGVVRVKTRRGKRTILTLIQLSEDRS